VFREPHPAPSAQTARAESRDRLGQKIAITLMPLPQRNLVSQPLSAAEFDSAASKIREVFAPTPQIRWPLLEQRTNCTVWVKHENHLPTGAFKVRGGVWFMHQLQLAGLAQNGVIAATRGNHGQSIAFAARRLGLTAVIVVPHGNSADKNRALRALGAELIEAGHDFDAARDCAEQLADERGLSMVPSFHPDLVQGVGTYACELLRAAPDLDVVYAPVGLGSGLCGLLAARNALGLETEIVGVVAEQADAYARSFLAGEVISTASADTLADGLAVRVPSPAALNFLRSGVARIVTVSEAAILFAIRCYFEDTHNLAEGAGAASLAALLAERERMAGKRVGVILSGGNLDSALLQRALQAHPV
jgi:threonine dehydratase